MHAYLDTLRVVSQIALRNLFASRLKTLIVGGIIFFGALLVVVGSAVVDSIDRAMTRSVVGSVSGHLQVYSRESKDELEVMGGMALEGPDIEALDDFAKVERALATVPNVKAVIPMGISGAIVTAGNTIDVALEKLRASVRLRQAGQPSPAFEAEREHVRQMIKVLSDDLKNVRRVQDEAALPAEDAAAVTRAASDEFWTEFDRAPLDGLEFLENRVAPLATDADMLFLRYVGTDPDAFRRSFDRLRIIDGKMIPRGERGFLFSKFVYEDQVKLKTARRMDKIKTALEQGGKTIATDAELKRFVEENKKQVREIELQLYGAALGSVRGKLQKELGSKETNVRALLAAFFATDDANFQRRYKFFYDQIAPHLQLYRVRVGDTLTIKAFTRSGYVQSVNLKVWGTFAFEGLETSQLAGALNLMDLVSFRDLYGFLTDERAAEIRALRESVGARDVSRERAEEELFGAAAAEEPKAVTADATAGAAALAELDQGFAGRLRRQDLSSRVYDPKELEKGVILNAAVILHDPSRLAESARQIEAAGAKAGLPLTAVSWQKASGLIGQMVLLLRGVLYTAVAIIFAVALVIISNALVMATLERVQEIGTLRAVGAQRRFVVAMLVVEALAIGLVFGALGAVVGIGVVLAIGKGGIPAPNDIFAFFFSGPRLYPTLGTFNVIVSLVIVFVVSALASFYPGWLAMRVSPRQAMQTED